MYVKILPTLLLILGACAAGSEKQVVEPSLPLAQSASPAKPVAAQAPATEAKTAPEVEKSQSFDVTDNCNAECDRNAATCAELDVEGCKKRCSTTLGETGVCEQLVVEFFTCLKATSYKCKAGNKLRPKGCGTQAMKVGACVYKQKAMQKEKPTNCDELCKQEGRCTMKDGLCVATSQKDCEASASCKEAGWCTFMVNFCGNTPKN